MSDTILYDVEMVELFPLDDKGIATTDKIRIICDSEVDLDPEISQGQEKILRDKKRILATATEDDLLYGYKLKFKNTTFNMAVASLIEGGNIVYDETEKTKIIGYNTPMLSEGSNLKPFKADVYIAQYEGDDVIGYMKLTLNKCKGKAVKLGFKKDFFAPEFEVKCRENTQAKLPIKGITFVKTLPV